MKSSSFRSFASSEFLEIRSCTKPFPGDLILVRNLRVLSQTDIRGRWLWSTIHRCRYRWPPKQIQKCIHGQPPVDPQNTRHFPPSEHYRKKYIRKGNSMGTKPSLVAMARAQGVGTGTKNDPTSFADLRRGYRIISWGSFRR